MSQEGQLITNSGALVRQGRYSGENVRKPRMAVYLAHGGDGLSTDFIANLQQLCDGDVALLPCISSSAAASTDSPSTPLLDLAKAIERSLSALRQSSTIHSLLVITPDAEATRPASRLSPIRAIAPVPRGGLAPGVKRRVLEFIERSLARPFVLRDLAAIAQLSAYHFARAFKQSVGVPPHRYIMQRRIATAAEIVKSTNHPLSAVAIDVGFADQSHFTRLFVRYTGETPRAFRRRHR